MPQVSIEINDEEHEMILEITDQINTEQAGNSGSAPDVTVADYAAAIVNGHLAIRIREAYETHARGLDLAALKLRLGPRKELDNG